MYASKHTCLRCVIPSMHIRLYACIHSPINVLDLLHNSCQTNCTNAPLPVSKDSWVIHSMNCFSTILTNHRAEMHNFPQIISNCRNYGQNDGNILFLSCNPNLTDVNLAWAEVKMWVCAQHLLELLNDSSCLHYRAVQSQELT